MRPGSQSHPGVGGDQLDPASEQRDLMADVQDLLISIGWAQTGSIGQEYLDGCVAPGPVGPLARPRCC